MWWRYVSTNAEFAALMSRELVGRALRRRPALGSARH
jgi:hypothetical protein